MAAAYSVSAFSYRQGAIEAPGERGPDVAESRFAGDGVDATDQRSHADA